MLRIWNQAATRHAAPALQQNAADAPLLSTSLMQRELLRERLRASRSGAVFSVLSMHLKHADDSPLVSALKKRVRMTDTAGYLNKNEIGVLLPDTAENGAWKLAEDLLALLPSDYPAPWCEVYVHPQQPAIQGGDVEAGDPPTGDGRARPIVHNAHHEPAAPRGSAAETGEAELVVEKGRVLSAETLFAQRLPLWKRALDVTGAGLGLLMLSPVMLAAAVAVKTTSRGPIFYAQQREGLGAQTFSMFKFRTMVVEADAIKKRLMHLNEQDGPAFKIEHDPRVTRIGSILRKTSIDELPQLINVLRGEMSLVGPRPLPVEESLACAPWQRRRLDVTPGLTCIWQIRDRRSKIAFADWVRMDVQYIQARSLRTDVKLIFQTMAAVLLRWRYR